MIEEKMNELLIDFQEGFESLFNIIQNQNGISMGNLTVQNRKLISETIIYLNELLQFTELEADEKYIANKWIQQLIHILGREFEGNFILRFYYFPDNYERDPYKNIHSMISLLVALRALNIAGPGLTLDGTVWHYLERDIPKFRRKIEEILTHSDSENINIDILFLLLNTLDTLGSIKNSEKISKEYKEFILLVNRNPSILKNGYKISPGLKVYVNDIVNRLNLSFEVDELSENFYGKPAAFLALMKLRNKNMPTVEEIKKARRSSCMHLWWIAKAWRLLLSGEKRVGFMPFESHIDIDDIFTTVWGKPETLSEIPITQEEKEIVLNFYSSDIKKQLYNYFINHPDVSVSSKSRLSDERDKADAGGEISDFNVEFKTHKGNLMVAFPIKSAHEVGKKNISEIKENFMYQFIRPLITFESKKAVVFPIVLTRSTLNANEMYSLIRSRFRLPIAILNLETYTKFLKRENMLIKKNNSV